MSVREPTWTVVADTFHSPWVGTRWDFFDDHASALVHYTSLLAAGCRATLRQYARAFDLVHLSDEQRAQVVAELRAEAGS